MESELQTGVKLLPKIQSMSQAEVIGIMETNITFMHLDHEMPIYEATIGVERISGAIDHVPLRIPGYAIKEIISEFEEIKNKCVKVSGEIRAKLVFDKEGNKERRTYLFVRSFTILGKDEECLAGFNKVKLVGTVCKTPQCRETPVSKKTITEFPMIIDQENKRTAYIYVLTWGSVAEFALKNIKIGSIIEVHGRLQSRGYKKNGVIIRTAYEVSTMELIKVLAQKGEAMTI